MKVLKNIINLNKIIISYSFSKIINFFIKDDIYLISERENEAEDNGYYLFKYIRENYPEEKAYYLINKKSKSYERVKKYGNIIHYNSWKHNLYYFLSKKHISAFQFFGVPDNALIWYLESKGLFKKKRVFLQHGVIKEALSFLNYDKTNYTLFICGAKLECEYVKENFKYPAGSVIYTGLARYDGLHNRKKNKKQILLMPTWRQWLGMTNIENDKNQDYENLINSDYYKNYMSFINSKELEILLDTKKYELLFYLHPEAQRFREYFSSKNSKVKIVSREGVFLQELLKESDILITDYSSVAFEFGYMRKKMMYYQFDNNAYYKNHFQKGYFDCERDGFGPVTFNERDLFENLKKLLSEEKMEEKYEKRSVKFFPLYDTDNSKRIFEHIRGL